MEHCGSTCAVTGRISKQLAERIGHHTYDMWFGNTTTFQIEGTCVRVNTDCQFVADWIDGHFRRELDGAAREALGAQAQIDLRVKPELFKKTVTRSNGTGTAAHRPPHAAMTPRRDADPAPRPPASLRRLEDYVVGPSNRLAFAAASQIAESAPDSPSLLFVHGECGVGKTHLLQGVAQRSMERAQGRPDTTVRYVTAEQFTNEYIQAVRGNTIDRFRRRTRKLKLLAIDDVHFLANKVATQNEFLHTFDAMDLAGARVVLASDKHPRCLGINQALSSRFVAGMVAEIEQPDHTTRIRLAQRLAASRGLKLSEAAAETIAGRCVTSVRELEGAFNKLAALRLLSGTANGTEVGLVLVEQLFSDGSWRPRTPVRISTVIDTVCARLVVSRAELMGSGRHRRVVAARGLVAYLGRELTTLSFPEIAQALGRKHHSTIHTAARRMARQLEAEHTIEIGESGEAITFSELADQLRRNIRKGAA